MNRQDEQHLRAWQERRADETRAMMRANMKYLMQVLVTVRDGKEERKEWVSISPSAGKPYLYNSEEEAERMLRMCYPDLQNSERRIVPAPGYE